MRGESGEGGGGGGAKVGGRGRMDTSLNLWCRTLNVKFQIAQCPITNLMIQKYIICKT